MCIAVPMQVIETNDENHTCKAIFSGNELEVNTGPVTPKVGDFILVHAGCTIEILKKDRADELAEIYAMLEEI